MVPAFQEVEWLFSPRLGPHAHTGFTALQAVLRGPPFSFTGAVGRSVSFPAAGRLLSRFVIEGEDKRHSVW